MSASWWFGAFRDRGAPTWYGDNRTPVLTDPTAVVVGVAFGIVLVAFLVIFPGIRRTKFTSFITVTLAIFVGALLIICSYYPAWHVSEVWITAPYKSFCSEKVYALLGVHVGLKYVNITLKGFPESREERQMDYNERFAFYDVKSMQADLRDSLDKGLPYPMLTVIEYFSVDKAGFTWGRRYRLAGYYTCILLWLSFALWLLHLIVLCLVPKFYSRLLMCLGVCILLADVTYVMSCPKTLYIPFSNTQGFTELLIFQFGWCLWSTLGAGFFCFLYGSVIRILEARTRYKFFTFVHEYDQDFDDQTAIFSTKMTRPLFKYDEQRRTRKVEGQPPYDDDDTTPKSRKSTAANSNSSGKNFDQPPPRDQFDHVMDADDDGGQNVLDDGSIVDSLKSFSSSSEERDENLAVIVSDEQPQTVLLMQVDELVQQPDDVFVEKLTTPDPGGSLCSSNTSGFSSQSKKAAVRRFKKLIGPADNKSSSSTTATTSPSPAADLGALNEERLFVQHLEKIRRQLAADDDDQTHRVHSAQPPEVDPADEDVSHRSRAASFVGRFQDARPTTCSPFFDQPCTSRGGGGGDQNGQSPAGRRACFTTTNNNKPIKRRYSALSTAHFRHNNKESIDLSFPRFDGGHDDDDNPPRRTLNIDVVCQQQPEAAGGSQKTTAAAASSPPSSGGSSILMSHHPPSNLKHPAARTIDEELDHHHRCLGDDDDVPDIGDDVAQRRGSIVRRRCVEEYCRRDVPSSPAADDDDDVTFEDCQQQAGCDMGHQHHNYNIYSKKKKNMPAWSLARRINGFEGSNLAGGSGGGKVVVLQRRKSISNGFNQNRDINVKRSSTFVRR